jgi:outer membrane cobalamin receptor
LTIELEPTPNYLETVQVTAKKSPFTVGDVAAPTTIVDRETIERRGDQRLTEAVEHVPGAIVTTELGVFESVLFRGMPRVGNEFTNTLLLIDGVPQTNSGNDARVVALPINDASNIEIVRGPNSALYGRTAIGGAINVLTADPTASPELKVDLTGGQFGTAKGVVGVSGPIQQWGGY